MNKHESAQLLAAKFFVARQLQGTNPIFACESRVDRCRAMVLEFTFKTSNVRF